MINGFKSKAAQDIFDGVTSRDARKISVELHAKIRRLLDQINAVSNIETLRIPPSNRLEKLKGNLRNHWSLRINKQWRIIFNWKNGTAFEIDIIDYHQEN